MINEFEVRMVKFRQSTGADLDTEVKLPYTFCGMIIRQESATS